MKVIFHIGMGKTGTSSIQSALLESKDLLAKEKAEYLGMWFDFLGIQQKRFAGIDFLIDAPSEVQENLAELFMKNLHNRAKVHHFETFIFSNEGLFAGGNQLGPFFGRLRELCELKIIAYMRDPHQWLISAYNQWAIVHKFNEGPIESFAENAPARIMTYQAIRGWVEDFSEILSVRLHEKKLDVVEDFFGQIGYSFFPNTARHLESGEPALLLLRAMFNNRIASQVLPEHFNRVVMNPARGVGSAQEMAERCFRHDNLSEIIEEQRPLFQFIKDKLALDFLTDTSLEYPFPDPTTLQSRLIDHLIEANFQQAEALRRLERTVAELKDQIGPSTP